ncbi:hypothetical protein LCGC14_1228120 [marine sediment metagenome]|uniref:Uncharacterized protein n=1 Tax=marine sediment metagenome TaxID=412755 RepID=A0A0F9LDD1_9ZZZZ
MIHVSFPEFGRCIAVRTPPVRFEEHFFSYPGFWCSHYPPVWDDIAGSVCFRDTDISRQTVSVRSREEITGFAAEHTFRDDNYSVKSTFSIPREKVSVCTPGGIYLPPQVGCPYVGSVV